MVRENEKRVEQHSVWGKKREEEAENLREIMNNQLKDKEEAMKRTVVKVIKEKEELVRHTVEKKKCVMVFGIREGKTPMRQEREKNEKNVAGKLVEVAINETNDCQGEIEEVSRIGRYEEGKNRPMRIKFKSQTSAEEVLNGAWRLGKREDYKNIWIRRDMNEEERNKTSELWKQAKEKNESRSEEEKKKFYWRVRDMKLIKWMIGKIEGGERN